MARASAALALFVAGLAAAPSAAETARYAIAIGGIGIGEATLSVNEEGGRYEARLSGDFAFLLASGSAEISSSGAVAKGALRAERYDQSVRSSEPQQVSIRFAGGGVRSVVFEPEREARETRGIVPIKDADTKGVLDPLSAILTQARKAGAAPAEACRGTLPVFGGATRFRLDLSPAGERDGAALCSVKFTPISGHRAGNRNTRRLAGSDRIRIAFPKDGQGPYRLPDYVRVPLRWGDLEISRRD
jgi:hypothetical protein